MKRIILSLVVIIISVTLTTAQEAKKMIKNAEKDLAKYYQDQVGNADKLLAAIDNIKLAFQDDMVKADPEAWIAKGKVYYAAGSGEVTKQALNPTYKITDLSTGIESANAYLKALELALKKNHTKDAVAGLVETETLLNNFGIMAYQAGDYKSAFENFVAYLNSSDVIKSNGETSKLADATLKADIEYYALATGGLGSVEESKLNDLAMKMYKAGTDKPLVYETLYKINLPKDEAVAIKYLEEGRLKFPDDSGLLFTEINQYLAKGKLDELTGKLKSALAKEPDNISIYTTLGSVYDQLTTQERKNGNVEKTKEYFDLAYDYYNQALTKDPKNFDAIYSLGALYYNKAAAMTEELNKLSNDYSAAGTKKYNALKAEMDGVFEQALPYFVKAEGINGSDLNTMIALKEIYARKGMLDKSSEYKTKIEAIGTGK